MQENNNLTWIFYSYIHKGWRDDCRPSFSSYHPYRTSDNCFSLWHPRIQPNPHRPSSSSGIQEAKAEDYLNPCVWGQPECNPGSLFLNKIYKYYIIYKYITVVCYFSFSETRSYVIQVRLKLLILLFLQVLVCVTTFGFIFSCWDRGWLSSLG